MVKRNLTNSDIHRKNIINNNYAIAEIEQQVALEGIVIDETVWYTKKQLAIYYQVDERTIERYLKKYEVELATSGYKVLSGNQLRVFKSKYREQIWGDDIHVATPEANVALERLSNISSLGLFTFKAFLNIGMLLTESETAKELRSLILNIVLDVFHQRLGGHTKYINQAEEHFLESAILEVNYRSIFTDAIDKCIVPNKWKFAQFTDLIYKSIFKEDAKEYKQILKLGKNEAVKATLYAEVLDIIASYENGFANRLTEVTERGQNPLSMTQARALFSSFEQDSYPILKPLIIKARTLMASRDIAFRDAYHQKLKDYIQNLDEQEFENFLGQKSQKVEERLLENIAIFKRLKNR